MPPRTLRVVTLGLAIPFAVNRWYRLTAETTSFASAIDIDELESIQDAAASPVIEGLGEAGDALAEIGDLFGGG